MTNLQLLQVIEKTLTNLELALEEPRKNTDSMWILWFDIGNLKDKTRELVEEEKRNESSTSQPK